MVPAGILSLLLFAAPGQAQSPPAPGPQVPPGQASAAEEYQEKQQRFAAIHDEAFRSNEELRTRQTELNEKILGALQEEHAPAEVQMARLEELRVEASAAQQAGDMEQLNALIAEAGMIQGELQAAQEQVLAREDVQADIESLEADLMEAMLEVDPEAQALLDRLDELAVVLNLARP
jgi:hypothetical protein